MKYAGRTTKFYELLIIILAAAVFIIPILLKVQSLFFRLDSDYETILPIITFFTETIRQTHSIPLVNPYLSTGMSVLGDPISPVLNPFITIPIYFFGTETGGRLIFIGTVLVSGISMWLLLHSLGLGKFERIWGAILYEVSGSLAALYASGHFLAPFAVVPLFYMLILKPEVTQKKIILLSLLLSFIIYLGDFYQTLYLCIFYIVTRLYYILVKKSDLYKTITYSMGLIVLSFIFSSFKLVPYFLYVLPVTSRFFPIDPYAGSIHIFLIPLSFILPFHEAFYDRPFIQRVFGFHYNWYEYFAFLSPLPLLFLRKLKSILTKHYVVPIIVLMLTAFSVISLRYPYSPFYWVFHIVTPLQAFRANQRILISTTCLVVVLLSVTLSAWLKSNKSSKIFAIVIAFATVLWTGIVSQGTVAKGFEPYRSREADFVTELSRRDSSRYYVVTFVCCMQTFFMEHHIALLNYYHALRKNDAPNFVNSSGEGTNYAVLARVRPKYVIGPLSFDAGRYGYQPYFQTTLARVWITQHPTINPTSL